MPRKPIVSSVLLCLVLAIWILPVLNQAWGFIKEKPLQGYFIEPKDTVITARNWFDGRYAFVKEKYLNDHFGFRSACVRIKNQCYYSAFNDISSQDVIIGKEGYMYEYKYVTSYAGRDYLGDRQTDLRFEMLKYIQDSLAKKGITLVLILAPGKASYLPEYLPDSCNFVSLNTNYIRHALDAKKYCINHIDMCKWFQEMKPGSLYPLYPKTSMHWSVYSRYLVLDSISKYLEKKLGRKLPEYKINAIEWKEKPIWQDQDIEPSLNLLFDLPAFKLAYPQIAWQDSAGTIRPRILTVGDSYWGSLMALNIVQNTYSHPEFWPYGNIVEKFPAVAPSFTWQADLKTTVERQDVIFIVAGEANLRNIGWNFIEQVYAMFKNGAAAYPGLQASRRKSIEIALLMTDITTNSGWLSSIKEYAAATHMTLDSAIHESASRIYFEKHPDEQVEKLKK